MPPNVRFLALLLLLPALIACQRESSKAHAEGAHAAVYCANPELGGAAFWLGMISRSIDSYGPQEWSDFMDGWNSMVDESAQLDQSNVGLVPFQIDQVIANAQ